MFILNIHFLRLACLKKHQPERNPNLCVNKYQYISRLLDKHLHGYEYVPHLPTALKNNSRWSYKNLYMSKNAVSKDFNSFSTRPNTV